MWKACRTFVISQVMSLQFLFSHIENWHVMTLHNPTIGCIISMRYVLYLAKGYCWSYNYNTFQIYFFLFLQLFLNICFLPSTHISKDLPWEHPRFMYLNGFWPEPSQTKWMMFVCHVTYDKLLYHCFYSIL